MLPRTPSLLNDESIRFLSGFGHEGGKKSKDKRKDTAPWLDQSVGVGNFWEQFNDKDCSAFSVNLSVSMCSKNSYIIYFRHI